MRFFHISDLHIGKQLYSYSLLPDQRAVLHEITERAKEYHPDAILIAGDVFGPLDSLRGGLYGAG